MATTSLRPGYMLVGGKAFPVHGATDENGKLIIHNCSTGGGSDGRPAVKTLMVPAADLRRSPRIKMQEPASLDR